MKILEVKNLKKYFPIHRGIFRKVVGEVKAVDDVSFEIGNEEIVGLVGESGSGKSTAGRAVLRLIEPTAGEVHFLGENLLTLSQKQLRSYRQKMQMVFQDPLSSLNPRKTVLENVGDALLYHKLVDNREQQIEMVVNVLKKVGINPDTLSHYPHQFSGGQQQRISIGRAIALRPKFIVCDEAVSALDLSVQAQILNLLYELKNTYQLSYLFISHDLSVVRSLCDRVLVMYKGKIVESGPAEAVFQSPQHPYTKLLLSSVPHSMPGMKKEKTALPERKNSGSGCPFFERCPLAKNECKETPPPMKIKGTHSYACIF